MTTAIDFLRNRFWARRSVEERILLATSRQDPQEDGTWQTRVQELAATPGVSWSTVLGTAVAHQVSPLVFHNLIRCGDRVVDGIPEDVRNAFHMEMVGNLAAKQAMAKALARALVFFREEGIDVMLVKGTALDHRVYDEPWYTVSGDIDLLLRPGANGSLARVWPRLVEMNTGRPTIDVHSGRHPDLVMNGILPLDFDRIWAAAERITVAGEPAYLMAPVDELLCACINSCRKRYFRLKSLCEIASLLKRHPRLSFDVLGERAAAATCQGIVYAALTATAVAVNTALPDNLEQPLGISGPRAAMLRFLVGRMSFSSLPRLYESRNVLGKNLGSSLLLPYVSLGWRRAGRSLWVAGSQMAAGPS